VRCRDIKPANILASADATGKVHRGALSLSSSSGADADTAKLQVRLRLGDMAFAHFDTGFNLCAECGTPEYQVRLGAGPQ
jgi:hypothetical protein